MPFWEATAFQKGKEEKVRELASFYFPDSDIGVFVGEYPFSVKTPSGDLEGSLFLFSSGKGCVVGGSNQCYGSVSLLQADLSHDSSLTFNAYSGDLIEDGELLAQKSELPARGIVPNGGAELYGSAADPRPLSKYIEEKYGRDCKLDCWTSLDYRGTTQQDFGNYLEERNGYWANAEPNCTLTACYNVFDYLAGAKPSIFPSAMKKTSPYDIRFEESAMYSYFLTMSVQKKLYKFRDGVERKYGEDYSALPVKNRTDLYRQVRSASFQTKTTWYSENPGGLDIWQTSQMAERVANVYDIQGFDSWEEINYNRYVGTEDFKNNFDVRSTPIIFATSTGVYGSHQIAVFGYRFYKLEKKVLFFNVTEWKCILDVLDGWSASRRYFDITDYNGNIGAFLIWNYAE